MLDPYLTTLGVILGLLILGLIMQVINHVRILKIERSIKERLDDLCIRK